jgi:hypothetical protein
VGSGEKRGFRQNDELKQGVFQKQNAPEPSKNEMSEQRQQTGGYAGLRPQGGQLRPREFALSCARAEQGQ